MRFEHRLNRQWVCKSRYSWIIRVVS